MLLLDKMYVSFYFGLMNKVINSRAYCVSSNIKQNHFCQQFQHNNNKKNLKSIRYLLKQQQQQQQQQRNSQ